MIWGGGVGSETTQDVIPREMRKAVRNGWCIIVGGKQRARRVGVRVITAKL